MTDHDDELATRLRSFGEGSRAVPMSTASLHRVGNQRARRKQTAVAAGTAIVALGVTGGVLALTLHPAGTTSPAATPSTATPTPRDPSANPAPATRTPPAVPGELGTRPAPGGPEQKCKVALPEAWRTALGSPLTLPEINTFEIPSSGAFVAAKPAVDGRLTLEFHATPTGPAVTATVPGWRVTTSTDGVWVMIAVSDSRDERKPGDMERVYAWQPGKGEPTLLHDATKAGVPGPFTWVRDGVGYWSAKNAGRFYARNLATGEQTITEGVYGPILREDGTLRASSQPSGMPGGVAQTFKVTGTQVTLVSSAKTAPLGTDPHTIWQGDGGDRYLFRDGKWELVMEPIPGETTGASTVDDDLVLIEVDGKKTYLVDYRNGSYAESPTTGNALWSGWLTKSNRARDAAAVPVRVSTLPRLPKC